jgi:hypothetical protein
MDTAVETPGQQATMADKPVDLSSSLAFRELLRFRR